MGRLMGLEPMSAGATIQCVNQLHHSRHSAPLLLHKCTSNCNSKLKKICCIIFIKNGGVYMSYEKAKTYLEEKGYADNIIIPETKSGTVEEAANALGVKPEMIAKTLSLLIHDEVILIVTEGTSKIDNHKYKQTFHIKAKMIPYDEVETLVGHAPGGVCPFGIHEGIKVYLDKSLQKFETVYPACGSDQSAVKMSIQELEDASNYVKWVDVCKE